MWADAWRMLAELRELLTVLLQKAVKVRVGSPLCVVDDTSAVFAAVQRCPDVARLLLDLFDKTNLLIDQRLLLLRPGLKDVDQRHQVALLGNKHFFPPLEYNST